MSTETLILRGVNDLVEGEVFPLEYGQTVVVGRSSKADISLKKCKKYKDLSHEERKKNESFLKVSRQHVKISFYNSQSVEVEDKSANGTFVDGQRIEKLVIADIKDRPRELRLGPDIKFKLEWGIAEIQASAATENAEKKSELKAESKPEEKSEMKAEAKQEEKPEKKSSVGASKSSASHSKPKTDASKKSSAGGSKSSPSLPKVKPDNGK
ncbi:MAG: FHA domain-containing protein [Planctomycetota bacterium]|nr:FHA domain-containing protein [Planctomycetota bacterium]